MFSRLLIPIIRAPIIRILTQTRYEHYYTTNHEFIDFIDKTNIRIGVSDHAREQLGGIVYVETGELDTLDNVRKASNIAMHAGANFIKTSTGKISPAATMDMVYVMLNAIKDFHTETGIKIGMKPAGGISTAKKSLQYLVMLKETLGDEWMNKEFFRFGASSLANDILMQLKKQETGIYQSLDYFSKD